MGIEILRLGPDTADRLERVADDVFDAPVDRDRLAAYIAAPGHLMVLAVSGGVVVGHARAVVQLSPDQPPQLYVDNMGVTPARQREGVGGRLLDALLAWGREAGCASAWLATDHDNTPARALYAGRGGEVHEAVIYAFGDEAAT